MPKLWPWYFYPRPPRGGRHIPYLYRYIIVSISIHALREEGDPVKVSANTALILISIHALREEGDRASVGGFFVCLISIHALREEGDESFRTQRSGPNTFLSTPSARRAT